jgi:S-DNA-T family DNA segregation ATPase FtsK/SpoIIIE
MKNKQDTENEELEEISQDQEKEDIASEKKTKRHKKTSNFKNELWGIVFLAIGLLVFISLISFFINKNENILGPYLGVAMSKGMVFLFGYIPCLLIPVAIWFIGWKNIAGEEIKTSVLIFICLFILETSLLFSISNLPQIAKNTFDISSNNNFIGNILTQYISYIFGSHRFGPYFLTILFMFITGLLCFRINPVNFAINSYKVGIFLTQSFIGLFTKNKPPVLKLNKEKEDKKISKSKDDEDFKIQKEEIEEIEKQRQLQQEQELLAFRAKLKEPVKITTMAIDSNEKNTEPQEKEMQDEEQLEMHGVSNTQNTGKSPLLSGKTIGVQKPYRLPSPDVLSTPPETSLQVDEKAITENTQTLEKTLLNFGIEGKVTNVCYGPVVTRYEIELAPGVKVSRVLNLQNDIAMAVGGQKIRIEAPIPGKAAIGIELPNKNKQVVYFKHILLSEAFKKAKAKLPMIVGQNISGVPFVTDIDKMPHLLVAGQTGSGKSVCLNSIICSLLMTKTPEELRLIMIDPKKVELTIYEGIPHLVSPVVTEPKEAVKALYWAVMEIQRRFALLKKLRTRDIEGANERLIAKDYEDDLLTENEKIPLPRIVIIVDELADLMLTASKDVESHILRIAQLGRAAGIHLIVATQRPSVDIITGPIKANLASRIAFRTIQAIDSRTILGHQGAEQLLGMGDMLFLRNGAPDLERYHGAYISEKDVEAIVAEINSQNYQMEKFENFSDLVGDASSGPQGYSTDSGRDELFEEAARMIVSIGQGSTSLLQRRLKIGYARAGRLMDELFEAGIVGPPDGSRMREVKMKPDELEVFLQNLKSQNK